MIASPQAWYEQRLSTLSTRLKALQKKDSWLGWLRFIALAAGIAAAWLLFSKSLLLAIGILLVFLVVFIRLVYIDADNATAIANLTHLITLTETEIRYLAYTFADRPTGKIYEPALHPYANDLDIFGPASLFQLLNRAPSTQGEKALAQQLLSPASSAEVLERQAAVQELATDPTWMQQLLAYGHTASVNADTEARVNTWLQQSFRFSTALSWRIIRWIFPLASCSVVILFASGLLPESRFYFLLILFFFLGILIASRVTTVYNQLNRLAPAIESLANSIAHIENRAFTAARLLALQTPLKNSAAQALKSLGNILARLDYRLNPMVSVPLNALFAWDLQQAIALENWKRRYRNDLSQWFTILGEMEALVSVATLHFNQPSWHFPEIMDKPMLLDATDLGHPLISPQKRVASSFHSNGPGEIALVTGSNMAGKSTFLRTVGVNIVLGMMGAPVCAARLRLSPMQVMSSMRIADNLEESTSTFYAELKKLKAIIDAVNQEEPVFLLLDEILRGTNSTDRQKGSEALIRQLLRKKGTGILATHDLSLARLAEEYPEQLSNYHFDVQVTGEELFFDYRLKPGICKSMNASILMKKIGIEL